MANKKKRKKIITNVIAIIIILLVIISLLILKNLNKPTTTEEIAKCIGQNSVLYTQLGCSHCEDQEEIFGDNLQYLTKIDCFYEQDKCSEIEATPTWKIKGKYYKGVQDIEALKELTNC